MKTATYSLLMVVLFFSAATLAAQVVDDATIPPPPPVTDPGVDASASVEAGATATTAIPVAGAPVAATDQATPETPAPGAPLEEAGSIVITRESEEAKAAAAGAESEDLPQTASPLALLALFGVGSSGGALGLRALRRRG